VELAKIGIIPSSIEALLTGFGFDLQGKFEYSDSKPRLLYIDDGTDAASKFNLLTERLLSNPHTMVLIVSLSSAQTISFWDNDGILELSSVAFLQLPFSEEDVTMAISNLKAPNDAEIRTWRITALERKTLSEYKSLSHTGKLSFEAQTALPIRAIATASSISASSKSRLIGSQLQKLRTLDDSYLNNLRRLSELCPTENSPILQNSKQFLEGVSELLSLLSTEAEDYEFLQLLDKLSTLLTTLLTYESEC
jgi:hypothetical protein